MGMFLPQMYSKNGLRIDFVTKYRLIRKLGYFPKVLVTLKVAHEHQYAPNCAATLHVFHTLAL
jgi:hypothetical protein